MHGGVWITAARERANITLEELAGRAGLSLARLDALERGEERVGYDELVRLVALCGQRLRVTLEEDDGIDVAQVQQCMALTPTERVEQAARAANFILEARRSLRQASR